MFSQVTGYKRGNDKFTCSRVCGLIPDAVKGSIRVCRDHFRDEDFKRVPDTFPVENLDTLRDDAVPSRNLPPQPTPDFHSNSSRNCTICDKMLSKDEYLKHFREYHSDIKLGCPKCPSTFTSSELLQKHYQNNHQNKVERHTPRPDTSKKEVDGEIHDGLDDINDNSWEEDQRNFEEGRDMVDPLGACIVVRPNQKTCEVCGKTFSKSNNLRQHMRVHEGLRPYHCSHCGKGFRQKQNLERHERVHEGLRPYHCSRCSKGFTQKQHLKKHEDKKDKCRLQL